MSVRFYSGSTGGAWLDYFYCTTMFMYESGDRQKGLALKEYTGFYGIECLPPFMAIRTVINRADVRDVRWITERYLT